MSVRRSGTNVSYPSSVTTDGSVLMPHTYSTLDVDTWATLQATRRQNIRTSQGLRRALTKETPKKRRAPSAALCCCWRCLQRLLGPHGLVQLSAATVALSILLLQMKHPLMEADSFCPRSTICMGDWVDAALLLVSRVTAYGMYPLLVLVFVTKMHALTGWMASTQLSLWVQFEEFHALHKTAGQGIFVATALHTVFHIARWARDGDISMLVTCVSGQTGLIGCACTLLLVFPMQLEALRARIPWEARKYPHSVLGACFGVSIALHAPATHIIYVMITSVACWFLSWLVMNFAMTHRIESGHFHRLENSVVLRFKNPRGFAAHGYINVCVPFISRSEWHAFSVHTLRSNDASEDSDMSCVCIAKAGDWTRRLHEAIFIRTRRPVWIQGPFISPYSTASDFDCLICVASGVGITPAIHVLNSLTKDRVVHLIWVCRDPSMVEFYLSNISFRDDAWYLIFYTGTRDLMPVKQLPSTCVIYSHRPKLEQTLASIISFGSEEEGWPEELFADAEAFQNSQSQREQYMDWREITQSGSSEMTMKGVIMDMLRTYSQEQVLAHFTGDGEDMTLRQFLVLVASSGPDFEMTDALARDFRVTFQSGSDSGGTAASAVQSVDGDEPQSISRQKLVSFCRRFFVELTTSPNAPHFGLRDKFNLYTEAWVSFVSRWQVLYCGNSNAVLSELNTFCHSHRIPFKSEKFDW